MTNELMSPEFVETFRKLADAALERQIDLICSGLRSDVESAAMLRALRRIQSWNVADIEKAIALGSTALVGENYQTARREIVRERREAKMARAD